MYQFKRLGNMKPFIEMSDF